MMNAWMWIAKGYAYIYIFTKWAIGINLPGLGFLLRRVKHDYIFKFRGQLMAFNPKVASSYGLHIIGVEHEPETHSFLDFLFMQIQPIKTFVEVGANIGAFMIDVAKYKGVTCYGFEPSGDCVDAIHSSMVLNKRENYFIYKNLVGDEKKLVAFDEGKDPQGASVFTSNVSSQRVEQIT